MRCLWLILLLPFAAFAQTDQLTTISNCRDSVADIVNQAMAIIKRDYYRKNEVDWNLLASNVDQRVQRMESCEEASSILSWCFSQLEEKHSFIMPAPKAVEYTSKPEPLAQLNKNPESPSLQKLVGKIFSSIESDGVGYISVPWISTTDPELCTRIADSLQALIRRLDEAGVSKWIIDLRSNSGGNCWPMIAGMGPLLGEGVCGYFVFPEKRKPWIYKDGAAMHDATVIVKTTDSGYKVKTPVERIAVLIGPKTSSSGEILALAFKGRQNTTLFGLPTAGLTTANTTYTLRDKSLLVLSVCKEADRSGTVCTGKIHPDEAVTTPASFKGDDPIKNAALMWLDI